MDFQFDLSPQHPYNISLAYGVACAIVYTSVSLLGSKLISGYSGLRPSKQTEWNNRSTAMIHAGVFFVVAAKYWLTINPEFEIPEELDDYTLASIKGMVGYMIYDTIVEIWVTPTLDFGVLAHHAAGLISHIFALQFSESHCCFYIMFVYLAEASTPFLHYCWMLNSIENKSKSHEFALKIISAIVLVLFFVFRILLGPFCLWHMWTYQHRWDDQWFFYMEFIIVVFFVLLNYVWYVKLVQLVFRGIFTSKKKSKRKNK